MKNAALQNRHAGLRGSVYALFMLISVLNAFPVCAGSEDSELRKIRTVKSRLFFDADYYLAGKPDLSGAAFPPGAHSLLMLNQANGSRIDLLAPPENQNGKISRTAIYISDPVNIAFDTATFGAKGFGIYRLFLLDARLGELIAVKGGVRNAMQQDKFDRFDAREFNIADPQGMSLDPVSGRLYILDASGPNILALDPQPGRIYTAAKRTVISLPTELGKLRGLALNPADRHLYIAHPESRKLYKFTLNGALVATLEAAGQPFETPQGMIFAPSLDTTDPSSVFHLFVVTEGQSFGKVDEWAVRSPSWEIEQHRHE